MIEFPRELRRTAPAADPQAASRPIDAAPANDSGNRAGFQLVVFMRLLAGLWVVQGLAQWSAILLPRQPVFDTVPALQGAAIVFFAVFDLVAAAGLWLAVPWGGVIWLLAALAQIFAALALPGVYSMLWVGADSVLIAIYFLLTWRAGHASAPYSALRRRQDGAPD